MVKPAVAPSDLTEVGSELCVILGRFVRRLRQGHETGELTLSELSVLARLDRGGRFRPGCWPSRSGSGPRR